MFLLQLPNLRGFNNMSDKDFKYPIEQLKDAIKTLDSDREKQLEIYENLANWLFGVKGTMGEEGKRGLLDPDVIEQLVSLMQNMTQAAKTKADISKILFENQIILNDMNLSDEDGSDEEEIIDRKRALSIVNDFDDEEE